MSKPYIKSPIPYRNLTPSQYNDPNPLTKPQIYSAIKALSLPYYPVKAETKLIGLSSTNFVLTDCTLISVTPNLVCVRDSNNSLHHFSHAQFYCSNKTLINNLLNRAITYESYDAKFQY